MATYYVRTDGSNANTGTGSSAGQAWQTVTYALANMVLTTGTNYLYIAPGVYREAPTVTITPSSTQTLVISGDPTAAQFSGVTAGVVRLTNFASDTANPANGNILTISGKTYITIENIFFEQYSTTGTQYMIVGLSNPDYITIQKCVFSGQDNGTIRAGGISFSSSTTINQITIDKCTIVRTYIGLYLVSTAASSTTQNLACVNSLFINCDYCLDFEGNGLNRTVYNCSFQFFDRGGVYVIGQAGGTSIYNSLFYGGGTALTTSGVGITENYNRMISCIPRTNVAVPPNGANSQTVGVSGVDTGYGLLTGIVNQQMLSTILNSPNYNFGTTSGAPVSDMYGVTWTGANPDAGSATYRSLSAGTYTPTERNAGVITIAPGSTSQSIELYLGVTGLTSSSSGLSARYNRTRTASVSIPLVARTIAQAWTSGGFAEVDATNMPGVYRLDLPDAALAAGADDVTIVVRGASGTNGAVMTVKLSSGGLTSAQTAAAVWDAAYTSHTAANSFGARTLLTTADNRPATVGTSNHIHSNVHAIVDSTVAADELKGALLHDGISYVDTDVAQISSSTSDAVLDAAASSHNSAGSIGALIQDKTGYSLSTPQSFSTTGSVGSVTGSVATVANPDNIIDGVWDEQRTGHTASGSFGEKLQTNALADEMLARDLGSGFNAGNPEERTVRSALRAIRNKVNVGSSQMVVKKEDDTTDAWTASVTTTAVSSNVSGIDPN